MGTREELKVFTADFASKMITDNIYNKSPIFAYISRESKELEELKEANNLYDQLKKLNKQTKNLNGIINQ